MCAKDSEYNSRKFRSVLLPDWRIMASDQAQDLFTVQASVTLADQGSVSRPRSFEQDQGTTMHISTHDLDRQ